MKFSTYQRMRDNMDGGIKTLLGVSREHLLKKKKVEISDLLLTQEQKKSKEFAEQIEMLAAKKVYERLLEAKIQADNSTNQASIIEKNSTNTTQEDSQENNAYSFTKTDAGNETNEGGLNNIGGFQTKVSSVDEMLNNKFSLNSTDISNGLEFATGNIINNGDATSYSGDNSTFTNNPNLFSENLLTTYVIGQNTQDNIGQRNTNNVKIGNNLEKTGGIGGGEAEDDAKVHAVIAASNDEKKSCFGNLGANPNDAYGPCPDLDGQIILIDDKWFVVKDGEYVPLKKRPAPGSVFWWENPADLGNGWFYRTGDKEYGGNIEDTYLGDDSGQKDTDNVDEGLPTSASANLINFLKDYEKFSAMPYRGRDRNNRTVGYGHVITEEEGNKYDNGITEEEATELFNKDLEEVVYKYLNPWLKEHNVTLTQQQYDALVSFTFNTGQDWIKVHEDLRKILLSGNITEEAMRKEFDTWMTVDGKREPGLENRRRDELNIFFNGDYSRKN